jgi:hypothetical protein
MNDIENVDEGNGTVSGSHFFIISEAAHTTRSPGCQMLWRGLNWEMPSVTAVR